tara:strand:- start:2432 stop:2647 length:216 start_codon:yes stop_codon:yes gene_type:complete
MPKLWRSIVYAIGMGHANFELPMLTPNAVIVGNETEQDDVAWMEDFFGWNGIGPKRAVRSDTSEEILRQGD